MERTVQKLHPALAAGQRLVLRGSNVPAFSFQGSWDGGCALHSAAMAIAMLGHLERPLHVSQRRSGTDAEFWKRAQRYYLTGICLNELATLMWELNWGLRPELFEGAHARVVSFCEQELARGWPVVISWRERHRSSLHAVLVVGTESYQIGRALMSHTLLVLDPAEAEPSLAVYNVRMTYRVPGLRRTDRYAQYVTAHGRRIVELVGALSFRQVAARAARKDKPP